MTPATLIDAQGLTVRFGQRTVLDGVDLILQRGEIVTLIGPNGSGKTTFVRAVLGLVTPTGGSLDRAPNMTVGYVPQTLTVDETLPLTVRRFLDLGRTTDGETLAAVMADVGAPDVLDTPIQAVSGGQLKRILLARALLRQPDLLVLDEPAAGVDVTGQSAFYRLIGDIRDRYDCGVLLVSHDLHLVMAATDRVVCLNGHVCCHGVPESVTRHPEYLALFGEAPTAGLAVYAHHHDHEHDAVDGHAHDEDCDHG